jgi:hypothetical protein
MRAGLLGAIEAPHRGGGCHDLTGITDWIADNGCFGSNYIGDGPYLDWLESMTERFGPPGFGVCPDVPFDAAATLERAGPLLPQIRERGCPVAFAAQNGVQPSALPWDFIDVLFVAGDVAFKVGEDGRRIADAAHEHGKLVHLARVNTVRRLRVAQWIGADSCDGTYLCYGPDLNLARMTRWLDQLDANPMLMGSLALLV